MNKIEELYAKADAGDRVAQYDLAGYFGEMSHRFTDPDKKSYCLDQVLIWLEKSAKQGYQPAAQALSGIQAKFGVTAKKPEPKPAVQPAASPAPDAQPVMVDNFRREEPATVRETEAPADPVWSEPVPKAAPKAAPAAPTASKPVEKAPQDEHVEATTPSSEEKYVFSNDVAAVNGSRPLKSKNVRGDIPSQPRAWQPDGSSRIRKSQGAVDADDTRQYIPYSATNRPESKGTKEKTLIVVIAGVLCIALLIFGVAKMVNLFANHSDEGEQAEQSSEESSEESREESSQEVSQQTQPETSQEVSQQTQPETSQETSQQTQPETSQEPEPQIPEYDLSGADYLTVVPDTFLATQDIISYKVDSSDGLMLRSGPGTNYDALDSVPQDTGLEALAKKDNWVFVRYEGKYGWVIIDFMTVIG